MEGGGWEEFWMGKGLGLCLALGGMRLRPWWRIGQGMCLGLRICPANPYVVEMHGVEKSTRDRKYGYSVLVVEVVLKAGLMNNLLTADKPLPPPLFFF
jgi:hypothetical protein